MGLAIPLKHPQFYIMPGFTYRDVLNLYRMGKFPMSDSRESTQFAIVEPEYRGIIPLNGLHISRSLAKFIRRTEMTVTIDKAFDAVVWACAQPRPTEGGGTWISDSLRQLYRLFLDMGHAHSVEVWQDDELVGGLFGVTIGGAFFGESMFSLRSNASKLALVHLVERLNAGGFKLLDTQYLTQHLESMGGIEIAQSEYLELLKPALKVRGDFTALDNPVTIFQSTPIDQLASDP